MPKSFFLSPTSFYLTSLGVEGYKHAEMLTKNHVGYHRNVMLLLERAGLLGKDVPGPVLLFASVIVVLACQGNKFRMT
jgi:hypothetical protein